MLCVTELPPTPKSDLHGSSSHLDEIAIDFSMPCETTHVVLDSSRSALGVWEKAHKFRTDRDFATLRGTCPARLDMVSSSERPLSQDVSELHVSGNKLHLDHWDKFDPVKQRIKQNYVCSGNMSHGRNPAFDDNGGIAWRQGEQNRLPP